MYERIIRDQESITVGIQLSAANMTKDLKSNNKPVPLHLLHLLHNSKIEEDYNLITNKVDTQKESPQRTIHINS